MKKQSSKKVTGHLSSMINDNESSTLDIDKEGSDNCNLDSNNNGSMSSNVDNNNDQHYSGEMTSGKKEYTSCEQIINVDSIAANFNSISILESSSKMQQYPTMRNSSSGLSASLPAPRAPFLSSRPITSQDKLNNIPEVKLPQSVLSSNDAIPYGSLRESSQSFSIGGIGGRRDKWLGPKSWHPNNRFGNNNNDVCDDDIETPSEIPQSLTALKVMTQITSESKKRGEVSSPTEKEGSGQLDDDTSPDKLECFDFEL